MNNLEKINHFRDRISEIVSADVADKVFTHLHAQRGLCVRINKLRITKEEVVSELESQNIAFQDIQGIDFALFLQNIEKKVVTNLECYKSGGVYPQNLSSMFVPLVLAPQPDDRILDLCSAPGSKTSQIAAMMNNQGEIIAVERVKERYYRLRSVLDQLGVTNVTAHILDGRKFKDDFGFDRILVDAPCSSESILKLDEPKSFQYWSERKIKEMAHKQKGLLLNASRLLKPGGTLVYSTCTFAPEENEAVVTWVLRKNPDLELQAIDEICVPAYPCLFEWRARRFAMDVSRCLRIEPSEMTEGFFIAKFSKRL